MTSTDLTVLLPTLIKFWDSLKSQATYWLNGITPLKIELFWERHILSFLPVTEVPDFRPIGFNEVKLEMYDQIWGYPIQLLIPDKLCRLIIELAVQSLKGSVPPPGVNQYCPSQANDHVPLLHNLAEDHG